VIGAKGRLIRAIMDECGGVSIKFPPEGSNSDKVLIRGPKDDVEKAKKQLLELLNEKVGRFFSRNTIMYLLLYLLTVSQIKCLRLMQTK